MTLLILTLPLQGANLPHRSIETALKRVLNYIHIILYTNNDCNIGPFDLPSEFDTLNNDVLATRLREIGIQGHVYVWFMSFITHREL